MIFLRFLLRILREQKIKLVIVVILMTAVALMESVIVVLLVPLMSVVIGKGGVLPGTLGNLGEIIENALGFFHIGLSLLTVLVMINAAFIVQGLLRLLSLSFQGKLLANYAFSLIHKLFKSYLSSSWSFFIHNRTGHLVNVLSSERQRAVLAFQSACEVLSAFLIAVFYIAVLLLVSWPITLGGVILCSVISLGLKKFMERPFSYGINISSANSDLQAYAFDKLSAAKLLKSSATENLAVNHMDAIARRMVHFSYLTWMNSGQIQGIYRPLIIATLSLIVFFAITYLHANFAAILLFAFVFMRLVPYFSSFQQSYQQTLLNIPALQAIDKAIESSENMAETKTGKQIKGFNNSIVFDNVSFAYKDGVSVLKNINLEIKKNESIAIIGESGIGKTTLVDLLLGLFSPIVGQILIDGIPLGEYSLESWRRLIGYISQDVFLFHDTIETNLKWMAPEASSKEVEAAARGAYAHEFVTAMPNGYNTLVGDRGVKLSGGQRQRLALARIILQDPDIFILDEATSALDAESEKKFREAIEKITSSKTVIVISHRSSMLSNVDRIYMLKNGNIAEVGKQDDII
ncbi:ABC transporter ATP-binding protein [bacterium]|nr:MAG: ABC transporter ATP-binding protein [bacterium]